MADDIRWMTYAELAAALHIGADSARNLVRRKRWPRRPGNDGMARIGVPVEHIAEHARPDAPADGETDAATSPPIHPPIDIQATLAVLERHVERLERELAAAVVERDTERGRAGQVAVLEAVLEVERQRVAEAREEALRWRQLAVSPRSLWAWLRRGSRSTAMASAA